MTTLSQTDLTNCDREPIHIPGSIQSHGCVIATDVNASIILRHSSNLPACSGSRARSTAGRYRLR